MFLINVLLASDNNYIGLVGVLVYSILNNNESSFDNIDFYILDDGISTENQQKIRKIAESFNIDVNFYFIKYSIEELLDVELKSNMPLTAYARLFSCSLLPESIDKILYLDCDAVVSDSLKELWGTDLKDSYCGAVLDAGPSFNNVLLGLPEEHEHYNSGVLLINLKKWRADGLEHKFSNYLVLNNGQVHHNDQGVLNVICKDNILKLHPKYNLVSPFFEVGYDNVLKYTGQESYYSKEIVEEALENPVFIHLTQFINGRPWFTNASNHPLREVFDYYVQKTEFKDEIYVKDNRKLPGKLLSFLSKVLPYGCVCGMFKVYRKLK